MPAPKQQMLPPPVKLSVETSSEGAREYVLHEAFRIGRSEECTVCIQNEYVSRAHAEVNFENGTWCIRDLNSSNGIYVGDQRFPSISISETVSIRLGSGGPQITFWVLAQRQPSLLSGKATSAEFAGSETILASYVDRYFGKHTADEPAGQHTMFLRQAFAKVQKKQKRNFAKIVAVLILCLGLAGAYALYEHSQLKKQRAVAEALFYEMKTLDVNIAKLEGALAGSNNQSVAQVMRDNIAQRNKIEKNYDNLLSLMNFYDRRMTEQQRLIIRVARIFGECEVNTPPDFITEVEKYIKYWQSTGRFESAIRTANANGYTSTIAKAFLDQGLPPQFFYLAMQESGFDQYASGPPTRKGIAKGMWQFIPETAEKYGLKIGPLAEFRRVDPSDDRHHYDRQTLAAARYISDLYATDAQASGLLVMACYNWGERSVLPLVRSMPENPRERNFWQLLAKHRDQIPKETYDYVFYIISAAAIGENPHLFGFNVENPLAGLENR